MADEKQTEKDQKDKAKAPAKRKPAARKTESGSTAKKPSGRSTSKAKAPAKAKAQTAKAPAKPKKTDSPSKRKAPARKTEAKAKAKPKEAPERPVVNASARFVRVAPRKARMVANQVRGLPIDDARALLRFSSRGAAQNIIKLIDSAAANAEANHDLVADDLLIKDIHVDEGPTLRRYRPRALGRATRINKRTSHIAVALTPEE
jgi:ribosomal protein L22